jgi:hypothetical protein
MVRHEAVDARAREAPEQILDDQEKKNKRRMFVIKKRGPGAREFVS